MMKKRPTTGPTETGSLLPEAQLGLRVLIAFFEAREDALNRLLGRDYRTNPIRDEMMRRVCLDHAAGQTRSLAAYQKDLGRFWSKTSIARALDALVATNLVSILDDPSDHRARLIKPTGKLIGFYNEFMPSILDHARVVLDAAGRRPN